MALVLNGNGTVTGLSDISTDLVSTGDISAVDATLSGGVYVGGTGSANYLDDYEEGTWTPVLGGTSSGTMTIGTISNAKYTKIGNLVHVSFYIGSVNTNASNIYGTLRLTGLPFSAQTNYSQSISVNYTDMFNFDETDKGVGGYLEGSKVLFLRGASTSALTNGYLVNTTSGRMMFSMTYYAN